MKIIFNSDVLRHEGLVTGQLRKSLQTLLRTAGENGFQVVVPETTLLELRRQQQVLRATLSTQLLDAVETVRRYFPEFPRPPLEERVREHDIRDLIRACGVTPLIVEPTLADFRDAHHRACLHLEPLVPKAPREKRGSDEMRDLVIWAMAIRFARAESGAILVSQDSVHVGSNGNEEATRVQLRRVKTDEEAQELVGVETPAGRTVRALFAAIWRTLREAGLELADAPRVPAVEPVRFLQGARGPETITARVRLMTATGQTLAAMVSFELRGTRIVCVRLNEMTVDGTPRTPAELTVVAEPPADVSDALR